MKLCIIEIFLFERCTKVRRPTLAGLNTVVKLYSNDLQKKILNEANFYRYLEVANRLRDNLKSRRKTLIRSNVPEAQKLELDSRKHILKLVTRGAKGKEKVNRQV